MSGHQTQKLYTAVVLGHCQRSVGPGATLRRGQLPVGMYIWAHTPFISDGSWAERGFPTGRATPDAGRLAARRLSCRCAAHRHRPGRQPTASCMRAEAASPSGWGARAGLVWPDGLRAVPDGLPALHNTRKGGVVPSKGATRDQGRTPHSVLRKWSVRLLPSACAASGCPECLS